MATAAQLRANRENAQRSTGPRSEAGKQATKYNALKHGLAAQQLVLRDEDPAALEALRTQLRADHAPADETEAMLVEDLAQCWWRLQRARKCETRLIHSSMLGLKPLDERTMAGSVRYTSLAERGWQRAITQLRAAQNERIRRLLAHANPSPVEQPQPEPPSQPAEPEKVMAIGSVLQNQPQAAAEPFEEATPTQSTYPGSEEIIARETRLNTFMAEINRELATPERTRHPKSPKQ